MPTTNPVLHWGEIFNSLNRVAHEPLGGDCGAPLVVTVFLKGSLPHKVTASMGWGNLSTLRFKMKCLGWPRIINYIYKGIQGMYIWGHLMLMVLDGDRFCLYYSIFQGGFLWCVGERPLPWKRTVWGWTSDQGDAGVMATVDIPPRINVLFFSAQGPQLVAVLDGVYSLM